MRQRRMGMDFAMVFRYLFNFSKDGDMIYISHLDLLRLLSRAARRADLPVALSLGFSPHFKIKLKRALKLGVVSDNEEGEMILKNRLSEDEFKERLQGQLPQGIHIKEVRWEGVE